MDVVGPVLSFASESFDPMNSEERFSSIKKRNTSPNKSFKYVSSPRLNADEINCFYTNKLSSLVEDFFSYPITSLPNNDVMRSCFCMRLRR